MRRRSHPQRISNGLTNRNLDPGVVLWFRRVRVLRLLRVALSNRRERARTAYLSCSHAAPGRVPCGAWTLA